jgi:outer membrane protein OmpA-like peptidoglycan-associated protein
MLVMLRLCYVFFLIFPSLVLAQVKQDVANSSDHPLVGRYPGSYISQYTYSDYVTYKFPLTVNSSEKPSEFKTLGLEGQRTTIIYDIPNKVTTSVLKVFRSIESDLAVKGYKKSISCLGSNNECGFYFPRYVIDKLSRQKRYSNFKEFTNLFNGNLAIYSGQYTKNNNSYYIFVVVAQRVPSQFVQYSIDVLEEENLKQETLVLTSQKINQSLSEDGKVKISGINFDHDSANLTKDSFAALDTIADHIKNNPAVHFFVVGHTDNIGAYDYNVKLSQDRAAAVSMALINKYEINSERLKSIGIGSAAPVTSNSTEAGQAANRRVELVEAGVKHHKSIADISDQKKVFVLSGIYVTDMSGVTDPNVKAMAGTMPQFEFLENGIFTVSVGGKLATRGSYSISNNNPAEVSITTQGKTQKAMLSENNKRMVFVDGGKAGYIKQ